MKRVFADLHLRPEFQDFDRVARLVRKAGQLGFGLIGVTCYAGVSDTERKLLRSVTDESGVDLVFRVDLRPRSAEELLKSLRQVRRRFEVVGVSCEFKTVARQAAKDRRVDLLSFPRLGARERFFDVAEAELASGGLASLEVNVGDLLMLEGMARARLLSYLRREVALAGEFAVPIVFSSGISDELFLRRPLELAALGGLFGLTGQRAVDAVSEAPSHIVKRNREKLASGFIAPGMRVVRRGKDC